MSSPLGWGRTPLCPLQPLGGICCEVPSLGCTSQVSHHLPTVPHEDQTFDTWTFGEIIHIQTIEWVGLCPLQIYVLILMSSILDVTVFGEIGMFREEIKLKLSYETGPQSSMTSFCKKGIFEQGIMALICNLWVAEA